MGKFFHVDIAFRIEPLVSDHFFEDIVNLAVKIGFNYTVFFKFFLNHEDIQFGPDDKIVLFNNLRKDCQDIS